MSMFQCYRKWQVVVAVIHLGWWCADSEVLSALGEHSLLLLGKSRSPLVSSILRLYNELTEQAERERLSLTVDVILCSTVG